MRYLIIVIFTFLLVSSYAADKTASSIPELNKLAAEANPGDRIFLKAGTYKDAVINFTNNNGTSIAPVTISAEKAGQVFLEGNSSLNFSGKYIHIKDLIFRNGGHQLKNKQVIEFRTSEKEQASYCKVSDCVIDTYNNDTKTDVNTWVGIYGEYNVVERCLFKLKDNMGPTLVVWLENGKPAHHTINDNYFFGRQNGAAVDNGLESIRIGDSKTSFTDANCVIAFNRFEDCDGEIEIISNKSCHNSYFHNTFINCDGGLTLRHGNHTLCDGNFFDGKNKKLSYGIRFIGEGHVAINNYFINLHGAPNEQYRSPVSVLNGLVNTPINGYYRVKNAVIKDNIFVNCDAPLIRIGAFSPKREGMSQAPDTVTVKNNTFYDQRSMGNVLQVITNPALLILQHNKLTGGYAEKGTPGFEILQKKDEPGKGTGESYGYPVPKEKKAVLQDNAGVGADKVDTMLIGRMTGVKYTFQPASSVGPQWLRKSR